MVRRFYRTPSCLVAVRPQLLDSLQVPYETVDVLADPEIREGVNPRQSRVPECHGALVSSCGTG